MTDEEELASWFSETPSELNRVLQIRPRTDLLPFILWGGKNIYEERKAGVKRMTAGSMLIRNSVGEKTLLLITEGIASSKPEDNAFQDAKAALASEKKNPSPTPGNIAFLTNWIRLFQVQSQKVAEHPEYANSANASDAQKAPDFAEVKFNKPSWET